MKFVLLYIIMLFPTIYSWTSLRRELYVSMCEYLLCTCSSSLQHQALNIDIEGATRHSRKLMKEQKFDEYDPDSRTLRANLKLFESALNRDLGTPQYVEPGSGPTSSLPNVCLQVCMYLRAVTSTEFCTRVLDHV